MKYISATSLVIIVFFVLFADLRRGNNLPELKASEIDFVGERLPMPGMPLGLNIYRFIDRQTKTICYMRVSSNGESMSCIKN